MVLMRTLFLCIALMVTLAPMVQAATYYVKANGNDALDGRSDETAWRSISKVNSFRFNTGDDVLFKSGDLWRVDNDSQWLKVTWGGISDNHVIIGSYYLSNGTERMGVGSGSKPIIDGRSAYPTRGFPSDVNSALILVNYRDYVDVSNIRLINSHASGLRFTSSDYGTATNIELDYIRASGITFTSSDHGTVDGCIAHKVGTGSKYFGDADWGFAFGGASNANYITVKNSKAYECWSEGIGFYKGSHYGVAEYNYIWGASKVGIYVSEATNCIIRYNTVHGTTDRSFHRYIKGYSGDRGYPGAGIYISHEFRTSHPVHSTKIYGNHVASTSAGLRIGCSSDLSAFKNSVVYNNTFVDNYRGVYFYGDLFENSSFHNNIVWNPNGGTTLVQYGNGGFSGLSWSNNNWYPSSIHVGKDDIVKEPMLNKSSGWNELTGDDISISDFGITNESPLIDKGLKLADDYSLFVSPETQLFAHTVTKDQDDFGSSWEIGAQAFNSAGQASNTLQPPSLKIVINAEQ